VPQQARADNDCNALKIGAESVDYLKYMRDAQANNQVVFTAAGTSLLPPIAGSQSYSALALTGR
jgi:hypothetical protein